MSFFLDGEDFQVDTQTIVFPAGDQQECASFMIMDDDVNEPVEEFTACINSTPPGVKFTSGNSTTTVVIIDDDSKCHH